MITRFGVVMAAFTGDDFFTSASNSCSVVFRHFGDAVINESTASIVLNMGVLLLSILIGLLAMVQTAAFEEDDVTAAFEFQMDFDDISKYLTYIFRFAIFGFSGWVCYNTMLGLFFIILFPQIWTDTLNVSVYVGILCTITAKLIFTYLAALIKDSTSAMFLCVSIDKDNNTRSDKSAKVFKVVDNTYSDIHEPGNGGGLYVAQPTLGHSNPMYYVPPQMAQSQMAQPQMAQPQFMQPQQGQPMQLQGQPMQLQQGQPIQLQQSQPMMGAYAPMGPPGYTPQIGQQLHGHYSPAPPGTQHEFQQIPPLQMSHPQMPPMAPMGQQKMGHLPEPKQSMEEPNKKKTANEHEFIDQWSL